MGVNVRSKARISARTGARAMFIARVVPASARSSPPDRAFPCTTPLTP